MTTKWQKIHSYINIKKIVNKYTKNSDTPILSVWKMQIIDLFCKQNVSQGETSVRWFKKRVIVWHSKFKIVINPNSILFFLTFE